MDVLKEILNEFSNEIDYRLIIGAAAGIFIMIIEIILASKGFIGNKGKKRIERAREKGHVIEGHLVNSWYSTRTSEGGNVKYIYHGKYWYEINGKKKTKSVIFYDGPANNTIYFYYDNNPSKLYTERQATTNGVGGCLTMLIPVMVAVIVSWVLGYRG